MRKHWHNASERNPHREALLLYFASNPGAPGSTPDPDPTAPHTSYAGAGLTPEGHPITPENTPDASEAVAAGRNETRDAIAETLETSAPASAEKQKEKLNAAEVAEGFETMVKHLEAIREYRKDNRLTAEIKTFSAEEQKTAFEALHLVESQYDVASELRNASASLAEWKAGTLKPDAFRSSLENEFSQHPDIKQILAAFDREVDSGRLAPLVQQWNKNGVMEQHSQKIEVIDGIWRAIDGDERVREMQSYLESWSKHVEKVEESIRPKDAHEPTNKTDTSGASLMERIRGIRRNGIAGIGFYSPLEWYDATKKIYQAYKNAREENLDLMSNKLAVGITGALQNLHTPYGEAVNRRFTSTVEADFKKKMNEYKEELGDDDFNVLVKKFHDVRFDPPRAIAVLEVAASHGWVYDIADLQEDQKNATIFGVEYVSIAPPHWNESQRTNYLSTLTRTNNSGQKEERQKGYDRLKEQTDESVFKERYEAALESTNYWSAMGIAEVFIDRGKMPEVSEYLTLTLLEHLRTNPNARRYMTRPILEQFGIMNNKWGTANFAQVNIVYHKNDVYNLKKHPTDMNGSFLSVVERLQNDVYEASGRRLTKKEVVEHSSKILAGKTVTINGKVISIFNERYRDYWDESRNEMFGSFEGKQALNTSSDYYQMDGSVLLLPKVSLIAIFSTGSTGTLTTPEFAQNVVGQSIKRIQELKNADPEAAEIFRQEMGNKLQKALSLAFTGQAPMHLGKYNWKQGATEGGPMVASLIKNGFMTKEQVIKYAKGHKGDKEFEEELENQLAALD